MKFKDIKGLDRKVSELCLGTWVFGADGWGQQASESDCIEAVKQALTKGVNLIDTAPVYGLGRAEEIVGKAIKGRRDEVLIATKAGLRWQGRRVYNDLSAKSLRYEIDASLTRMGIETIDIFQLHWPDPATPIEETLTELKRIQDSGKIKVAGLSNFSLEQMQEASQSFLISTSQNQYSLCDASMETKLFPYCQQNHIGILAYGVLGGGILTGKYPDEQMFEKRDVRKFFYRFYQGETFQKIQALLEQMKIIAQPLNQIAINWVRQNPLVTSTLVGCRNAKQAASNFACADWDLTEDQISSLNGAKPC